MAEPGARDPYRPLQWPELIHRLRPLAVEAGAPVYLVGGAVRDALAGRPLHDVDLAVARGGIRLARRIANGLDGDFYALDRERDVGRALLKDDSGVTRVDVARLRGPDLASDLDERDFTINAMAVDLRRDYAQLIDPLGGEADARAKVLRQCRPSALHDDPLRALRALRLAAQFGLRIEPETRSAIHAVRERLGENSAERVRDEFWRLLALPRVDAALRAAMATGLLQQIVPETAALSTRPARSEEHADAWQETLAIVARLRQLVGAFGPRRGDQHGATFGVGLLALQLDRWRPQLQAHMQQTWPDGRAHSALLMLTALLGATGAPAMAAERARAMCLANAECKRLQAILRGPALPSVTSDLKLFRFWRGTGEAGVDVCLLAAARALGEAGYRLEQDAWLATVERIAGLLQARFERMDSLLASPPLLDGRRLMQELGMKPGPAVGALLERLREAQAGGRVRTEAEALAAARAWLEAKGSQ